MSEKLSKIDASPEAKGLQRDLRAEAPKNEQEFEVLLARFKAQNPEKYDLKMGNGDFKKQAKALGIQWDGEPKEEKVEKLLTKSESKKILEAAGIEFNPEASREELDALAKVQ